MTEFFLVGLFSALFQLLTDTLPLVLLFFIAYKTLKLVELR